MKTNPSNSLHWIDEWTRIATKTVTTIRAEDTSLTPNIKLAAIATRNQ